MYSHCQGSASLDLSHLVVANCVLDVIVDIDVPFNFRPSTETGNVLADLDIPDDGGVLLARADTGAVSRNGTID